MLSSAHCSAVDAKDAVIYNLDGQLDQKDEKIENFGRTVADVDARNAPSVRQINSQRAGQCDNTSFGSATKLVSMLRSCRSASLLLGTKIKELEA